jgi:SAM-dependent methyltransferase
VDVKFNSAYWESRWQLAQTGWDIGYPSDPIAAYFKQVSQKDAAILIPGCGNAWEGEFLLNAGFSGTHLIDIAPSAVQRIKERVPHFPKDQVILGDFFTHQGQYDFVVEQTFFCAIDPSLRARYAEQVFRLLKPGGKLVGVLFDCDFGNDHPPFGGSREEYTTYFHPAFEVLRMEKAPDSIKPRQGRELFIELMKPA